MRTDNNTPHALLWLVTQVLIGWSLHASARPFPPTPVPRKGYFDTNPAISADGKTVAWFHREGRDTRLMVTRAPFSAPLRSIVVRIHPHAALSPVLSGDGKHLFWSQRGKVHHARLEAKGPPPTLLELKAGPFGLCVSRDGKRLAMLVDGPPARGRNPGWRAVFTAALTGGSWKQVGPLTSTRHGADIGGLTMSADGNRLVFTRGHRPYEAVQKAGKWKVRRIAGIKPKKEILATALSAGGDTLLLQVRRREGKRNVIELRVLRRVDGKWRRETPAPLVKDEMILRPAIAPDGETIFWVHRRYSAPPGSAVIWTQLRAAVHRGGKWQQPVVLLKKGGYFQLLGAALGARGSLVYSMSTGRDRFEVFWRKDLGPKTKPLKLGGIP